MEEKKENNFKVIDAQLIDNELVILMEDLDTGEYFEITEETIKNKVSKVDLIIYKTVIKYLFKKIFEDTDNDDYIKIVTK